MNGLESTEIGMDENIEGAIAYLFGPITGILLLLLEKNNKFVKFHAIQSIGVFVVLIVLNMFISILYLIPYIYWMISLIQGLISLVTFILWVFLMFKAYQHEMFKVPVIGDIAYTNANK